MSDLFGSEVGTFLLDPPWHEPGGNGKGSDDHYRTIQDVATMRRVIIEADVWIPRHDGCALWMWTTVASLPDAVYLVAALGFTYVTNAVWRKARGTGQRLRICHEHLLFARRGSVPVPEPHGRLDSVFDRVERVRHSAKPAVQYAYADAQHPGGRKVEMFNRGGAPEGWETWGNEAK